MKAFVHTFTSPLYSRQLRGTEGHQSTERSDQDILSAGMQRVCGTYNRRCLSAPTLPHAEPEVRQGYGNGLIT